MAHSGTAELRFGWGLHWSIAGFIQFLYMCTFGMWPGHSLTCLRRGNEILGYDPWFTSSNTRVFKHHPHPYSETPPENTSTNSCNKCSYTVPRLRHMNETDVLRPWAVSILRSKISRARFLIYNHQILTRWRQQLSDGQLLSRAIIVTVLYRWQTSNVLTSTAQVVSFRRRQWRTFLILRFHLGRVR